MSTVNKTKTPEDKLLYAMFDGLTVEEGKYLNYLLPRIDVNSMLGLPVQNKGKLSVERARELFLKKFPNTIWMLH